MSSQRITPSRAALRFGLVCLVTCALGHPLAAQTPADGTTRTPEPSFTVSGSLIRQFDSDLERQGSYSVSSLQLRGSVARPVSRRTIVALSLGYDLLDYDFSDVAELESASPWERVHGLNLAMPIIRRINDRWSMLVSPSIGSFGASGAAFSDTFTYGLVLTAAYAFQPDRRLGFGVGAFDRIGQRRGFPFVSVDWAFTDRVRLSNPLAVGPTGPGGLELAYKVSPTWELGMGGAYRSIRFRLDDQDLEPNGIGEQRGIVIFARMLHQLTTKLEVVIYTGLIVNGELRIEDADAERRRTAEHDSAPLLAISLSGRF